VQTVADASKVPEVEPASQHGARARDVTLLALWGILNLCSFFHAVEGAAVLLLLALATDHKIRLAWLGIPAIVTFRFLTGNLWWTAAGARGNFSAFQIVWVVLAIIVSIQSICFFLSPAPSSERKR
jgi:hypothetical protein